MKGQGYTSLSAIVLSIYPSFGCGSDVLDLRDRVLIIHHLRHDTAVLGSIVEPTQGRALPHYLPLAKKHRIGLLVDQWQALRGWSFRHWISHYIIDVLICDDLFGFGLAGGTVNLADLSGRQNILRLRHVCIAIIVLARANAIFK